MSRTVPRLDRHDITRTFTLSGRKESVKVPEEVSPDYWVLPYYSSPKHRTYLPPTTNDSDFNNEY